MRSSTKTLVIMAALFVIGVMLGALVPVYENKNKNNNDNDENNNENNKETETVAAIKLVQDPSDVLRNPYVPPVRTASSECVYSQIGYLSQGKERIPLFGRRAGHRDKWYYYTEVNGIKLPVEFKQRSCTASPGCDMVGSRDVVKVDGQTYAVTVYENDAFTYNPFFV